MTHENDIPEQHKPAGEKQQSSTADYFIDYCITAASSRRQARTIRALYEEHHEAFAAYLSLEDVNTESGTLAEDYENAFIGTYVDEDALAEHELEAQGWTDAVNQVIREQGIPEGVLIWDHEALLEQLRRYLYDIVDLDGYLHVFSK